MPRAKNKIDIEDIVNNILKNEGPELDGKAYPGRRITYEELNAALKIIHSKNKLLHLKPYHFSNVNRIWNFEYKPQNKNLARELSDEYMRYLLKKNNNNLIEAIKEINCRRTEDSIMLKKFEVKTKFGKVQYNLVGMFGKIKFDDVHYNSSFHMLKYWIDTNPDIRIRTEYVNIRPWYLGKAGNETWTGEQGVKNGRELFDEYMQFMLKKYNQNLIKVITNMDTRSNPDSLLNKKLKFTTFEGSLEYDLNSMLNVVKFYKNRKKSLFTALKYWIDTHPDKTIRLQYKNLKKEDLKEK